MRDLTKYRLETAQERLEVSNEMLESGRFKISIINSYYAIFNAVRALLSERKVDFKKHSAVISYFRRGSKRKFNINTQSNFMRL